MAKASVPSSVWAVTPVVLKATAGLRLLPGEKATHLLDTVSQTPGISWVLTTMSSYKEFTDAALPRVSR